VFDCRYLEKTSQNTNLVPPGVLSVIFEVAIKYICDKCVFVDESTAGLIDTGIKL